MPGDTTLYVLAGPTAVGKTELALEWAERFDAEIVSCDSTLFYQGMDIGTAKPTLEEQVRVKHHALDLVPVNTPFSVKDYLVEAARVVREIHGRSKRVLITGGSGFYLKAFYAPVVDDLPEDEQIRETVRRIYDSQGLEGLVTHLQQLNPEGTGNVALQNPRRVARALERCMISGKTILELEAAFTVQDFPFRDYKKQTCVLVRDSVLLQERIKKRAHAMLEAGLIDEVRGLLEAGIEKNPSAAVAIGYRETLAHLRAGGEREALEAAIIANTLKLVSKQRKWLRHQVPVDNWVELPGTGDVVGQLFALEK